MDTDENWDGEIKTKAAPSDYDLARQRVKRIKRFYLSLFRYVVILGILITLNLTKTDFPNWIIWMVAVFGGLSLMRKWIEAYTPNAFLSKSWEERKIQAIVAQERGEKLKRGNTSDYFMDVDADADTDETYLLKRSG